MSSAAFGQRTIFSYLAKLVPTFFALATTFLIARVLGPADYGSFTFITALFGGFFLVFAGGMLTNTVFVFTAKYESRKIYRLMVVAAHAVALFIAAAFFVFPALKEMVGIETNQLLYYGIIFLFFTPFSLILSYVFKGFNRFGVVFKSTLAENISNLLLSLILVVFFKWGLEGIFIAKFISILFGVGVYLFEFKKLKFSEKKVDTREIVSFMGWNMLSDTFRQAGSQAVTIFAGMFLSPAALGSYYLAQKLASATVGIPSAAASEVLLSHAAKMSDPISVWRDMFRVIRVTLIISTLIGIMFFASLPFLVRAAFPQFEGVERLLGLFILLFISSALTFPANIFRTNNWMKMLAIFQLAGLMITLMIGWVLAQTMGAEGIILIQILVNVCLGFGLMAWIISTQRVPLKMIVFQKEDVRMVKKLMEKWYSDARRVIRN